MVAQCLRGVAHMSLSWQGVSLNRDHVLRALAHRWVSLLQGCGLPGSVLWMNRRGSCSVCPILSPAPGSPHSKGLFKPQCCSIHRRLLRFPWERTFLVGHTALPVPFPITASTTCSPQDKVHGLSLFFVPLSCTPKPCLAWAAARQTWSRTFPQCLWYQRTSKAEASP